MADSRPWSQVALLLQRLERISADSRWAHLASGYRGSLLKMLEDAEANKGLDGENAERLERLMEGGSSILMKAAYERLARRRI